MQLKSIKTLHLFAGLIAVLLTACASDGDNKAENSADIHLQLGIRYLEMNKLELAKENLLQTLDDDSGNTRAHNALAILYEKLKQPDDAKEQYEKALSLNAKNWSAKNNYGRFLCEHGEQEEGLVLLTETGSNPLNDRQWMALTNAGRCQLSLGKKQQAVNSFKQALLLNRSYAPALAEMQKIAYQSGDYLEAKNYLQRYLSVSNQTAETLWFASQTERALGNRELAEGYKKLLLQKFPMSKEAQNIAGINSN